jgi:hypothetical protein
MHESTQRLRIIKALGRAAVFIFPRTAVSSGVSGDFSRFNNKLTCALRQPEVYPKSFEDTTTAFGYE